MSDRSEHEELLVGFHYYLGMAINALPEWRLDFLRSNGYDIMPQLRALETYLASERMKLTEARRGDAFETWIKHWRDKFTRAGNVSDRWVYATLDDMLDDYRLHADTNTPLNQTVTEGEEQ